MKSIKKWNGKVNVESFFRYYTHFVLITSILLSEVNSIPECLFEFENNNNKRLLNPNSATSGWDAAVMLYFSLMATVTTDFKKWLLYSSHHDFQVNSWSLHDFTVKQPVTDS